MEPVEENTQQQIEHEIAKHKQKCTCTCIYTEIEVSQYMYS